MGQQRCLPTRNLNVIWQHENVFYDFPDVPTPILPVLDRRQMDPNLEFCNGDGRDSCIVLIQQNRIKVMAGSLQINQDRRVQQQSAHRPSSSPVPVTSSGSRRSQTDLRSSIHAGSGRWARRTAFNAAPFARGGAPSWAMTRPRRTIVKVSSPCSTASRRSAKLREASVAETSDIRVRLFGIAGSNRRPQASRTWWAASSTETTGGSVDHGKLIHLSVWHHTYSQSTTDWGFW